MVAYFSLREGALLRVLAIEQHRITLIGQGDYDCRVWYFAAHDWPTTAPVQPADLLVVLPPNPVGQSVLVDHAPHGVRNGYQYHLIFDIA
jgi:hypothetical protein